MKRISYIINLLLLPLCIMAQSADQNYILTRAYQTSDGKNYLDQIQYYDVFGRSVETVQKAQSSKDGNTWVDLVNLTEYDGFGREYKHWLPLPTSGKTGMYVPPTDFYGLANVEYGNSEKPYSTTDFEPSPLNRVTGKYGAGASWYANKKNDSTLFQTNANEVAYFFVNSSNQLQRNGNYAANTLYKTYVTDEDGKISIDYKDKQGKAIMKQNSTDVKTYFVYNDFGQLCYVLPPNAADLLNSSVVTLDNNYVLTNYAYLYKYDERGNNVVKRLPGCDSILMVYDKANRLVMSQDGNQRLKYKWTVTKYDVFGRVLYTGLLAATNTQKRKYFKDILYNQVVTETYNVANTFYNTGYTCSGSLTGIIPLTVNYYDNYLFTSLAIHGDSLNWVTPKTDYDSQYGNAKGLLTGTRSYILEQPDTYLTTAIYYDDRGRVVQTRATNQLGGYEKTYNHYDFTGRVLKLRKEHSTAYQPVAIPELYRNDYDQAGRLKTTYYQLNSNPEILLIDQSQPNSYDELGRLIMKKRHGGADSESYTYNIRNWATQIKSGAFEEDLYYNSNVPSSATACYNGNIAASTWTYNTSKYTYPYGYDQLNRLLWTGGGGSNGNYESFTYDKEGNIQTLSRTSGFTSIDQLTIQYIGNQVERVDDKYGSSHQASIKEYQNDVTTFYEFTYDKNGNMIKDLDRNIVSIRYNILNLPDTIQFSTGNQIINRYAANGQKLETEYFTMITPLVIPLAKDTVCKWTYSSGLINQTGTAYIDNLEYQIYNGNIQSPQLLRVYNSEGYSANINASWAFNYYRKDHLGNIREVWRAAYVRAGGTNIAANTDQRTQYYPSGLPWAEGQNPSDQQRKFNGKEFDEMSGYDTYDYGARGYYPALGCFQSLDPLAEKYYSISPYAYCRGNPVNMIDPDGKLVIFINGMNNGSGGKPKYWEKEFDKKVMNQIKDWNADYIDGSYGGVKSLPWNISAGSRTDVGEEKGKEYALYYIFAFKNSDGSFKETIKIITHSMGAAYAKGFIKGLIKGGVPLDQIEFEADFAPFQPKKQKAIKGVYTVQFSHSNDKIAGNEKIEGAKFMDTSTDKDQDHGINTYLNDVQKLPSGKYKIVDNNLVPF